MPRLSIRRSINGGYTLKSNGIVRPINRKYDKRMNKLIGPGKLKQRILFTGKRYYILSPDGTKQFLNKAMFSQKKKTGGQLSVVTKKGGKTGQISNSIVINNASTPTVTRRRRRKAMPNNPTGGAGGGGAGNKLEPSMLQVMAAMVPRQVQQNIDLNRLIAQITLAQKSPTIAEKVKAVTAHTSAPIAEGDAFTGPGAVYVVQSIDLNNGTVNVINRKRTSGNVIRKKISTLQSYKHVSASEYNKNLDQYQDGEIAALEDRVEEKAVAEAIPEAPKHKITRAKLTGNRRPTSDLAGDKVPAAASPLTAEFGEADSSTRTNDFSKFLSEVAASAAESESDSGSVHTSELTETAGSEADNNTGDISGKELVANYSDHN